MFESDKLVELDSCWHPVLVLFNNKPKKGPEGLERRLGSELDLTVYQIYVSVDIHTPRSTKYNVERRAQMSTNHCFIIFIRFRAERARMRRATALSPENWTTWIHLCTQFGSCWALLGDLGPSWADLGRS